LFYLSKRCVLRAARTIVGHLKDDRCLLLEEVPIFALELSKCCAVVSSKLNRVNGLDLLAAPAANLNIRNLNAQMPRIYVVQRVMEHPHTLRELREELTGLVQTLCLRSLTEEVRELPELVEEAVVGPLILLLIITTTLWVYGLHVASPLRVLSELGKEKLEELRVLDGETIDLGDLVDSHLALL
jgi:hypothetical protein